MTTTIHTSGVTFAHAAAMLAGHLTDHALPEPVSLSVTTSYGDSTVTAQLRGTTVPGIAGDLIAWADTLTVVTVEAWRPSERDRVHLSIRGTLTGSALAVEVKVFGAVDYDPHWFADLQPHPCQEASLALAQLRTWAENPSTTTDTPLLPQPPGPTMTPTPSLPPGTVAEIVTRAGRPDFDRWAEQVTRCGYCSHPVRLRGRVEHRSTSGRQVTYSTDAEPDRVLLIRCGNRRAAVCPSCSYEYAGDMWQLLYAGAAGGRKGVPESIRSHPLVFATLTAPGFGPVHTTRADRSGPARCRSTRGTPQLCPHGRPSWCRAIHAEDDPRLGQPICPDCYDYPGHVAFNWHAPELWRRFTIAVRRVLARTARLTVTEFARRCRVSFVKVAEFQRRGVVHFHALIRLDGPGEDYQPPQINIDAIELAEAIRRAAAHVRLTVDMPDGPGLVLRFGEQLDTQTVNGGPGGELTPEHAARYIAKYSTKSAEDFGIGERRITPEALPLLDVTDHVDQLVRVAWQLGEHEAYEGLRRWVHMLGFRGHFASKSRHYSTTLGAIRGERRAYRQRQTAEHARELLPGEQDTTLVVARWEFAGVGYLTSGDTALALSAAARAREQRQAAREAA